MQMLDATADRERLNQISKQILGCAFAVSNGLGSGFLGKVYENALAHELRKAGLKVTGLRLCLLLNFGKPRVEIRRVSL